MSRYLVDRLRSRITVYEHTPVTSLSRVLGKLQVNSSSGPLVDAVFTFTGAGPFHRFPVETCKGAYVKTTRFATSHPGVFCIGDVRYGSTKRIAAAVGDGSSCVADLHSYLKGSH